MMPIQKKLRGGGAQCLIFLFLVYLFVGCQDNHNKRIIVATAANMESAMRALVEVYTGLTGLELEIIVGSSGKLTAQIIEGAPYDVFVAANMKYPQAVYDSGKAKKAPKVYANGRLVLWSMDENILVAITTLSDSIVEHIALANPKTAPYGVAAEEVLQHYGLKEVLGSKLVFGESIGQTDQFIVSQAAQIGFTALSTVLSPQMKGKGRWLVVDRSLYSNISQGVVLVDREENTNQDAQDFYNFLFSDEAMEVLKEFGYLIDE